MTVKAPNIACPKCSAQNSPGRDICFKCRESLEVIDGSAPSLPSVFNLASDVPSWANTIWHVVAAPGSLLGQDGLPEHSIIVREVGRDSLVFDSDYSYQPSEGVTLEFELEGRAVQLEATVTRSARTLGQEMGFATTVDLNEPDPEYLDAVTSLNPVDDKEWWD